jgi:hypothetical protein
MPVPGATVLFPGELTFMAGTGLLRCRSEFATELWHVPILRCGSIQKPSGFLRHSSHAMLP